MTLLKKDEKLVHDDLFAITSSLFERRQRAASKWTGPWWSCCDDGSVQAHRVPRSIQVTAVLPSIWTQRSINWKKNGSYVLSLWRRISKNVWSFTHSYVVPNLYDFLLQSIKTQKTILETRLYWWLWLPLYCGKKTLQYVSEYLILCSTEDGKSCTFGMTRGWVNDYRICILGWSL